MSLLVAIGGSMLAAAPAKAANVVAEPTQIMELMRKAGYTVEQKTVKGDTYLRSSRGKDAYKFNIFFYGCDENTVRNCKTVQFYAAFSPKAKPTLEALNTYSAENRWGRFYRDKDNDPIIEMDLDLEDGGMSDELFLDNLEYFETVTSKYADFVFKEQ